MHREEQGKACGVSGQPDGVGGGSTRYSGIWLILLDHSASMGEPFAGGTGSGGRVRVTDAEFKLEAAKEELLAHISGLGHQEVMVFAFTLRASLIFRGRSDQVEQLRRELSSLHATNGTSGPVR
jgi:hypothetical protein